MKASELRIGNLAYNTKGEVDAIDIDALRYLLSYGDTSICQVKPISLTEEWLLRFGFEDNKLRLGVYDICISPPNSAFYNGCGFPCKYVHQLQNLYFALTGDELTIKE